MSRNDLLELDNSSLASRLIRVTNKIIAGERELQDLRDDRYNALDLYQSLSHKDIIDMAKTETRLEAMDSRIAKLSLIQLGRLAKIEEITYLLRIGMEHYADDED